MASTILEAPEKVIDLRADSKPEVKRVAQELKVNPNTAARAFRELEREGWVEVVRGERGERQVVLLRFQAVVHRLDGVAGTKTRLLRLRDSSRIRLVVSASGRQTGGIGAISRIVATRGIRVIKETKAIRGISQIRGTKFRDRIT